MQGFQILLQIGAGTGLVFLLRWFWWRINTWSEISAMVISFVVAVYFGFFHTRLGFARWDPSAELVMGVAVTTVGWLVVTFLTPPVDTQRRSGTSTPRSGRSDRGWDAVVPRTDGAGLGWDGVKATRARAASSPPAFSLGSSGCVMVYAALFGTGFPAVRKCGWGINRSDRGGGGGLGSAEAAAQGRFSDLTLPPMGHTAASGRPVVRHPGVGRLK